MSFFNGISPPDACMDSLGPGKQSGLKLFYVYKQLIIMLMNGL